MTNRYRRHLGQTAGWVIQLAADIIVARLQGVRRTVGEDAVEREWRRDGEATPAYAAIVEHGPRKQLAAAEPESEDADADLVIWTVLGV